MTISHYVHKLGNGVGHVASGILGIAALQNLSEGRYVAASVNAMAAGMIAGIIHMRKQDYQAQQHSRQFAEDFEKIGS